MNDHALRAASAEAARRQASRPVFSNEPSAVLGLREAVMLIVGVVIGAGIFKAPSMVAGMTGSAPWMFGAWILGGVISLIGALCYAELTTAYPSAGGDYHFLKRAYGRSVSFLFGWARFSVITTGSIALLAFVFGDYLQQALPLYLGGRAIGPVVYAVTAILVLWWINSRGIKAGTSAQTWLTAAEVGGLLLIVAAALWLAGATSHQPAAPAAGAAAAPSLSSFGLAMVFVLLTYGGWNEAGYISAELKDKRRNMVRALVLSILVITALYLLVTWAYWRGLGLEGMAKSQALAADLMRVAFGTVGEKIIAVLVAVAAVTSINATMIVGARTNYAVGRDWPALGKLAFWDSERGTPANAMHVQNIAALLLVALGAWTGSGFRSMVEFTAPVFWLFFLLSGLALFVLRRREPATERPFKVPLYPLLPLLFVATCAYMLWSSLSYVYSQSLGGLNAAWIGVAVLAVGLLLLLALDRGAGRTAASPRP
ncbi:APC family permease [Ramlibacter tataouinensis]|uniref:Candidate amino acid permease n=1 Tax=Ramlibacter tataouinensis (strain ATCC BAA-407 / DSM 14655 / LMG 21543 / TTB310) TaxID=365046 RepID=F5XY70_RAMTT|nr:amino acid permease [Ramlibacter tataouinensis]AEG91863.1 Candidate amino acid permease [Ramlibacter tataouinensis TTB310]